MTYASVDFVYYKFPMQPFFIIPIFYIVYCPWNILEITMKCKSHCRPTDNFQSNVLSYDVTLMSLLRGLLYAHFQANLLTP